MKNKKLKINYYFFFKYIFFLSFFLIFLVFLGLVVLNKNKIKEVKAQTNNNLVVNGSFEEDWNGWHKDNQGTQEIITESGKGKILHQNNPNSSSRIIQWVPIENNQVYKFSLAIKGNSDQNNCHIVKADEWCIKGQNQNRFIQGSGNLFSNDQNWNRKVWFFLSGSCSQGENHRLAIFFDTYVDQQKNINCTGEVFADDVSLLPVSRTKRYSAVIIGDQPLAVDYGYSDVNRKMFFLNKGQAKESADKIVYLPSILKNAYDKSYTSGIMVMNTENKRTNISLKIYNKNQSNVLKGYSFDLDPYSTLYIWPSAYSDWPNNSDLPAMLTSTETKIIADVDVRSADSTMGYSYEGITEKKTDSTWFLPIILKDQYNEGWYSEIIIQNTEEKSGQASIFLFEDNKNYQCNITIPAFGQKIINFSKPEDQSCFNPLLPAKARFSAKISSEIKLAVIYRHFTNLKQIYIGENANSLSSLNNNNQKIFVPRIYKKYNNWVSSLTLFNIAPRYDSDNKEVNYNFKITYVKQNGQIINNQECNLLTLNGHKSTILYYPNISCLEENSFYSGIIESTNLEPNLVPLASVYHIEYPAQFNNDNSLINRGGATSFSENETSRVFFIPRVYFFSPSLNWNSDLLIQNAGDNNNTFSIYILDSYQGKIVARREGISFNSAGQSKQYYIPDEFKSDLEDESIRGQDYPPIPSDNDNGNPQATLTPACEKRNLGDANCDGSINNDDYTIWECEFLGNGRCSDTFSNLAASFDLDRKVDLIDFEIWRKNAPIPPPFRR